MLSMFPIVHGLKLIYSPKLFLFKSLGKWEKIHWEWSVSPVIGRGSSGQSKQVFMPKYNLKWKFWRGWEKKFPFAMKLFQKGPLKPPLLKRWVSAWVRVCLGYSVSNQPQKFGSDPSCTANRDLSGKWTPLIREQSQTWFYSEGQTQVRKHAWYLSH